MSQPLVSIIVPVYGIEKYIGKCAESLMEQTYSNLEILLVDDGSPDRSPQLCDLYARKDSRIKVIHKPNGGLVSARKAGLAASRGEYICYVDGDDWVEPGFVKDFVQAIDSCGADIATGSYTKDLFSYKYRIDELLPRGEYEGERLNWLQSRMMSLGGLFQTGFSTYLWDKIFRREVLLEAQMQADDRLTIGEDTAVVYPAAMLARKIVVTDTCDNHYRQRDDSMLENSLSTKGLREKLRIFYEYMSSFSGRYNAVCNWQKQVEDLVLGICVMHLGGNDVFSEQIAGADVVLFKAGVFGQHYRHYLEESGLCHVTGWLDDAYRQYRRCGLDVDPIEAIAGMHFDYVLLTSLERPVAADATSRMLALGVPKAKILSVNESGDRHLRLLQYLYP